MSERHSHICKSKVRQTALEQAGALRPFNKFERVSEEFYDFIEATVRNAIVSRVKGQPSKGITLK